MYCITVVGQNQCSFKKKITNIDTFSICPAESTKDFDNKRKHTYPVIMFMYWLILNEEQNAGIILSRVWVMLISLSSFYSDIFFQILNLMFWVSVGYLKVI